MLVQGFQSKQVGLVGIFSNTQQCSDKVEYTVEVAWIAFFSFDTSTICFSTLSWSGAAFEHISLPWNIMLYPNVNKSVHLSFNGPADSNLKCSSWQVFYLPTARWKNQIVNSCAQVHLQSKKEDKEQQIQHMFLMELEYTDYQFRIFAFFDTHHNLEWKFPGDDLWKRVWIVQGALSSGTFLLRISHTNAQALMCKHKSPSLALSYTQSCS